MRKTALSAAVFMAAGLYACPGAQMIVSPGVTIGVNIGNVSQSDSLGNDMDTDAKAGLDAGLVVDIELMDMISLITGASFVMRGSSYEEAYPFIGNVSIDANANYIDIPILAALKFPADPLTSFLAIGPEIGLLMSAEAHMSTMGTDTTMDVKEEMRTVEIGIRMNGGAEIDLEPIVPFIQAGYYLGLTNAVKEPVGEESTSYSGIVITGGVRFRM